MKLDDLRYFEPRHAIDFSVNRLPHWQQAGATYFVTFRLSDSLPQCLLDAWKSERSGWLRRHPQPWSESDAREYRREFVELVERWLDAGHGDCRLAEPVGAALVVAALRHSDGSRYVLICAVVMPNHVHVVFALREGFQLERIVHAWKLFSARRINELHATRGPVWQKDYFDRLVRSRDHLAQCVRYVRQNPERAGLRPGTYMLIETALSQEID